MKKFEYLKKNEPISEFELNGLGNEGWKLISHIIAYRTYHVCHECWIFMREVNNENKPINSED
jgi:hypothetical protein